MFFEDTLHRAGISDQEIVNFLLVLRAIEIEERGTVRELVGPEAEEAQKRLDRINLLMVVGSERLISDVAALSGYALQHHIFPLDSEVTDRRRLLEQMIEKIHAFRQQADSPASA